MSAPRAVRLRCPGKVNLHLEVVARRPDGYHELRTLFAAVGVWDDLEVAAVESKDLSLEVEPAGAVAVTDNLVLRAAIAAREAWGVSSGARILLHKRIPVAGGMGGGSADAAATLVAVAALWDRHLPNAALHGLAARLGSDVPFFLAGGAGWGEGRGERLRPLPDLPPWWLLILPGAEPVPTAEVYRLLDLGAIPRRSAAAVYDWLAGGGELPLSACRNDLEPTVIAFSPTVGIRLAALRATAPLLAMVSGSGGTVFAVYQGEEKARAEAGRLALYRPIVAPLLGREQSALRPGIVEGE
jgi:4-diphosphocytidyl-2-C-methyl-D-erythritol kinase